MKPTTENEADKPGLSAASCSATGEPRVKTLLRSMIAALDRKDSDTYWATFEMLLSLHEKMMKTPNDKAEPPNKNV